MEYLEYFIRKNTASTMPLEYVYPMLAGFIVVGIIAGLLKLQTDAYIKAIGDALYKLLLLNVASAVYYWDIRIAGILLLVTLFSSVTSAIIFVVYKKTVSLSIK